MKTLQKIKCIVAGSRSFNDYNLLEEKLNYYFSETLYGNIEIVSGMAKGADTLGEQYATQRCIKIKQFPADWRSFGKSAGMIRNKSMAKYATHAVLFWDGASKGTKNMIKLAEEHNLIKKVITY